MGMIRKRFQDGQPAAEAYDNVIAVIEEGVNDMETRAAELKKKLQDAQEPEDYIKRRLDPYAIQVELQMYLLHAARQLKQEGWTP